MLSAGVAYIDWIAQAGANRWIFLPGLVISGAGMGFIWTPVFSLATRDLKPHLAGVGSGVINTIQELGSVVASAAVGALLQNRLATALHQYATSYSGQLPPAFRNPFVSGFDQAAHKGFEVGAGQTGGSLNLPAGVPPEVVAQVQHLAHEVFTHAFADAMKAAILLPLAVLLLAAALTFGVRKSGAQAEPAEVSPAA
jgi:hypothetical protein